MLSVGMDMDMDMALSVFVFLKTQLLVFVLIIIPWAEDPALRPNYLLCYLFKPSIKIKISSYS